MAANKDNYFVTKGGADPSYYSPPPPPLPDCSNDHYSESECSYAPSIPSSYAADTGSAPTYAPSSLSSSPKSTAKKVHTYNTPTFSLASHSSPAKSPNRNTTSKYSRQHPQSASKSPNKYSRCPPAPCFPPSVSSHSFYYTAPVRRRQPRMLFNRDCGAEYKSLAAVTRADHVLIKHLLNSEQVTIIAAICLYYHYRMNTIRAPRALSQPAIRGIFEVEFVKYQYSVHELYKRLAMRYGQIFNRDVNSLNFNNLPGAEVQRFIDYLERVGTWKTDDGKEVKLFSFGQDDHGKLWLKVKANEFTLNIVQLLNSIHDNMRQWRNMVYKWRSIWSFEVEDYFYGVKWIENTCGTPAFQFC